MIIKCCKDCKERQLGCHSTCEKYLKERGMKDKENDRLFLEYDLPASTHHRNLMKHIYSNTKKKKNRPHIV